MKITGDSVLFPTALDYWDLQGQGESPPEKIFAGLLVKAVVMAFLDGANAGLEAEIKAQHELPALGYHLDFSVTVTDEGKAITTLAFEVDGLAFHGDQRAFARDRKRDRDLAQAGIETFRFTAKEVTDGSLVVLAELWRTIDAAFQRAFKTLSAPVGG